MVFGISLLVALVLSAPSLLGAMHGTVDMVQAGIHLLVAIAISWAGCYGVGSLVYGYAQNAAVPSHEPMPVTPVAANPTNSASGDATIALDRRAGDVDATALPPIAAAPAAAAPLPAPSDAIEAA
jgi:hypothetical protein